MRRSARSLAFLSAGCVMVAVLAVVLFAGVGTGGSSSSANAGSGGLAAVAPGIAPVDANLLEQVYRDFADQLHVDGIDVADPRSAAARFAARLGVTYPLLADPGGVTAAAYEVTGLPVTFVVSSSGEILARHQGPLSGPELEAVLQMDFPQFNQG